jgi:hypothetical protein
VTANKIIILCENCGAKNRVDPTLKDHVVRCGKCGNQLSLALTDNIAPAIEKLRDAAGKVKMEFEAYTRYKVCSISVDLVEDTIHIKWKVETDVEDLWRLKQRWPIEYYFTIKMILAVSKSAPDLLRVFAVSFYERYLNFSPEDEGANFRDLCLLSVKGDMKQLRELDKRFTSEDVLTLTGQKRQTAMEDLQQFTRDNMAVRQNYKGTLTNKSSLIYKAVKPFDLAGEAEETLEEIYIKESVDGKENKKIAAMKLIEENIDKMKRLETQYIGVFARKYGLGNEERRRNLKELLDSKNIKLPEKVIYKLIQKELDEIEYERFYKKIKAPEPLSLNHYIRRFLELITDSEEQIDHFYKFLVSEKIIIEDVSTNVDKLKDLVNKVRKSIDIEQFERKLVGDFTAETTAAALDKVPDVKALLSSVDPASESYRFLAQTLSPGKTGDIPGVIRLYIDNFMDNPNNRAMLLYFLRSVDLIKDPNEINLTEEIKKIQYEDIPEPIEDKSEIFDSFSSQEILNQLTQFDYGKYIHLMRFLFQRMGFNAGIIKKEEGKAGLIFLDNQEDEKLIVQFFYHDGYLDAENLKSIPALVSEYHADYGISTCSGFFSKEAIQFALENDIELIDQNKIKRLIANIL